MTTTTSEPRGADDELLRHLADTLWTLRVVMIGAVPALGVNLAAHGVRLPALLWAVAALAITGGGLWVTRQIQRAPDATRWSGAIVAAAAGAAGVWSAPSLLLGASTVPLAILRFLPPVVVVGSASVLFCAWIRAYVAAVVPVTLIYFVSSATEGMSVFAATELGFVLTLIVFSVQAVWLNRSLRSQFTARRLADGLAASLKLEQQATLAAHEAMRQLAERDPLTGAFNRRYLTTHVDRITRGDAGAEPVWLAMLDLDHFKATNDRHGHAAGDRLLQELVRCAATALPSDAVLARWGGEEFVALLPGPQPQAVDALRELQASFAVRTPTGSVTFSAGLAPWPADAAFDDALRTADAALYRAKNEGRNRVVVLGGTPLVLAGP
jgi:diguanylate cyclase (GGDEF)-like protein